MTKFLNLRTALIASVGGAILIGSLAATHAFADDSGRGQRGDITRDAMIEKAGEGFDRMDADGDGVVTQAEADTAMGERQAKAQERMAKMFERMDADGSGAIEEGERGYDRFAERLGVEGPITMEQIQAGMGDRGGDRSGDAPTFPQTKAEAETAAGERFDAMDANGDGVLSGDEAPNKGGRGGHGGKKGGERGERGERGTRGSNDAA